MSSPRQPSIEIALTGLRFHARVGILPHERELPQPIEVDIRVGRDGGAGGVLDYRHLHALAAGAISKAPIDYLETIAREVLDGALALDGALWARVAVRKPHVGLPDPVQHAEIVMEGANE